MQTSDNQRQTSGIAQRILRASSATFMGFAGTQALRLAGNLVLTRLLMPEAFGLMTLMVVLMTGLKMFSDLGIGQSILRSPRGDDSAFLDTAWTVDLLRGVLLWALAALAAWPMARFYGIPDLTSLVPVIALVLILGGMEPTRVDTAARHLHLGRVTLIELASQALGLVLTIGLAFLFRSVWALVAGQILAACLRLLLIRLWLPGRANRLRLEPEALRELLVFGRWLFLSTVAGFLMAQGDKLVLSAFLSLQELGIYNIAWFLAAVPTMLGGALTGRLMLPLYRDHPPAARRENFLLLRRLRLSQNLALLALSGLLAFAGPWLVGLIYDPRYLAAGPVLVALALVLALQLITQGYDQVALASGASKQYCLLSVARGIVYLACVLTGAWAGGLAGAILGQALAQILSYPMVALLARAHGAWDPLLDAILATVLLIVAAPALAFHLRAVTTLM